mgnify:CR=1 FL=1
MAEVYSDWRNWAASSILGGDTRIRGCIIIVLLRQLVICPQQMQLQKGEHNSIFLS